MPTDTLMPALSGLSVRATLGGTVTDSTFIDKLKDTLEDAGWELTGSLIASGTIDLPLGLPLASGAVLPVKSVATCSGARTVTINGTKFVGYNPRASVAGSGSCVFWAYGDDVAASAVSLANAITGGSQYTATSVHISGAFHYRLDMLAKGGGPTYNTQDIQGSGYVPGGSVLGGGYVMSCITGTSLYSFSVMGTARAAPHPYLRIKFVFTLNGSLTGKTWNIDVPSGSSFVFVANPYAFTFFDPSNDNYFLANTSLFAAALNYPTSWLNPYAVFVVGDKCFRTSVCRWINTETALAGVPNFWNNGAYPQPLCARTPLSRLTTLDGVALVQGAYMLLGRTRADTPSVVGRLWDCVITTEYIPSGGRLIIDNGLWEVVSSQSGSGNQTQCSVLWRYADVEP